MSFMLLMLCARGHTWDFFYFLKYQSVRNGWEFRVHISFSLCLIRFNITDITDPVYLIMTRYKPSPASVQQALLKAIIMWLIIQVFCESLITEHLLTAQLHKGRPWVSGAQYSLNASKYLLCLKNDRMYQTRIIVQSIVWRCASL